MSIGQRMRILLADVAIVVLDRMSRKMLAIVIAFTLFFLPYALLFLYEATTTKRGTHWLDFVLQLRRESNSGRDFGFGSFLPSFTETAPLLPSHFAQYPLNGTQSPT